MSLRVHQRFFVKITWAAAFLFGVWSQDARAASLSVEQLDALCSTTTVPSKAELDAVADATKLRTELSDAVRSAKAFAATRPKPEACHQLIVDLDEVRFAPLAAARQSLCDMRAARRGFGAHGLDLSQATRSAADAIRESKEKQLDSADACKEAVEHVAEGVQSWLLTAAQVCPLEETSAPATCGTLAPDGTTRVAAVNVCNAYLQDRVIPRGDRNTIADCLKNHPDAAGAREIGDQAPVHSTRAAATGAAETRALGGAALETAILQGVANFFVERAEQELSLFTADLVADRLCRAEVKTYLGNTCALLKPEDSSEPVLGATPLAIREAVRADLDALPSAVATRIGKDDAKLACGVAFGWGFAQQAISGVDVVTLLTDPDRILKVAPAATACDETMQEQIEGIAKELKKVIETGKFELPGLVRAGRFTNVIDMSEPGERVIAGKTGELGELGELARKVLGRLQELDRAIAALKVESTPTTRAAVVAAGVRTIEPILVHLVPAQEVKIHGAVNLTVQLSNREYGAAIITFSNLSIVPEGNLRNVLSLAAALAQADSAEGVQASMKAAALPVGSWRRKNENRFGITLTGVVGGFVGNESVLKDAASGASVDKGLTFAPSLLVGFDFHQGIAGKARVGLNLSVLDIGALGTVRFKTPEVEGGKQGSEAARGPNVRFEQVLAPTAFLYVGGGPVVIGPAVGFVPSLRELTTPDASTNMLGVVRVGAILGVDVSVLPLL